MMIEYATFFLAILIPNILRQLVYLRACKKSRSYGFIVSNETRRMLEKGWLPWAGILEEIFFATLWTFFWFVIKWEWLAFGWVSDALLDCAIAYSYAHGKRKPKILFAGTRGSFFVREILLPYLIIGPALWILGLNIYAYVAASTIICIALLKV